MRRVVGRRRGSEGRLLERLGAPMYDIVADPASRHTMLCDVAVRLWRPIGPEVDLPTGAKSAEQYADRLPRLWGQAGRPCSPATVADALNCMNRRRLAHDDRSAVLVDGDIHEMNALQASDGSYKLIDPAGLRANRPAISAPSCGATRTLAMTSGRGPSSWLPAMAWMPPPSGNGEPSTESSADSTPASSAFSPLAISCWPKRIVSRRSRLGAELGLQQQRARRVRRRLQLVRRLASTWCRRRRAATSGCSSCWSSRSTSRRPRAARSGCSRCWKTCRRSPG